MRTQLTWEIVSSSSDFRKFDDVLRLTVDCAVEQIRQVEALLDLAVANGEVKYGLHCQTHVIMTCLVPAEGKNSHLHFLDGLDCGYVKAAMELSISNRS